MSLAETFQQILDALPSDWTDLELDLRIADESQYVDSAVALTRPGGTLVYCTCSLEPEEGVDIVSDLLKRDAGVRRVPLTASEVGGVADFISAEGDLRTLPCHLPDADSRLGGVDGFYAARLEKL